MAVALGTLTFVRANGLTKSVEVEVQDGVGDLATYDAGAGAATGTDTLNLDESMNLVHISMLGATTATALRLIINGTPTNQKVHHNVDYLHSNVNKPPLNIAFANGTRFQLIGE